MERLDCQSCSPGSNIFLSFSENYRKGRNPTGNFYEGSGLLLGKILQNDPLFLLFQVIGDEPQGKENTGPDQVALGPVPDDLIPGRVQELASIRGEAFQDSESETIFPFSRRDDGVDEPRFLEQTHMINRLGIGRRKPLLFLCVREKIAH